MNNSVEKLAKTVDEAIEEALADLGIASDDAIIEVLDEGDPGGLLGFGRRPARVRVSRASADLEAAENSYTDLPSQTTAGGSYPYDANFEEEDEAEQAALADSTYSGAPAEAWEDEAFEEESTDQAYEENFDEDLADQDDARDSELEEYSPEEKALLEDKAVEFVANILQNLGIHGRISSFYADDGSLQIDVSGDDLGNAIGRRGETLDAIQYLTTLAINQDHDRYQRVYLDIDFYRNRQMKQLRQKARKSAERVLKSGRTYVMDPMTAAERRQIHLALADFQGITTYSEGQEPQRSVVISRVDDKKPRRNNR